MGAIYTPTDTNRIVSDEHWFVMRDLKRPNAKLRAFQMLRELDDVRISVYTPMTERMVRYGGKVKRIEVPFINDLLFVRSTRSVLDPIVESVSTFQYRYARGGRYNDPMVVDDLSMNRFIAATSACESYHLYRPEEVSASMYGRRIKIVGGNLDGFEGRLMTTRGSKVRRLIVELEGLLAVGVEVNPEFIRLLDK